MARSSRPSDTSPTLRLSRQRGLKCDGTHRSTLAAVLRCAKVGEGAEMRGFGWVAEWFKAAVLKTASREHRKAAESLKTRTFPSRKIRVPCLFAKNRLTRNMAQEEMVAGPGRVSRANRNKKMRGRSWVYFAQAGEGGPVKIGQSRQVHVRIRALAAANHAEITLLGTLPETVVSESYLLNYFGPHRLRGEWHEPVPELLELAEAGRRIYENGYVVCAADVDQEAWSTICPFSVLDRINHARRPRLSHLEESVS